MIQYLNVFFYDIYPYLCGTVFILGSWLRYDYGQYTGEPLPARCWTNAAWCYGQTCSTSAFWGSFRALVWHVNSALDVCWFLPIAVKQQMAMIAGGLCGVLTLVGGAGLLVRRLTNPRIRATSSTADILILCVLLIQCILGLTTIPFSAQHPDGSEMLKLVGWAQSVVTFKGGASAHLDGVALIFRVHLVLGMTIFLLFPFTRLVHVWSAPFEYFTRRYQIVRSRR